MCCYHGLLFRQKGEEEALSVLTWNKPQGRPLSRRKVETGNGMVRERHTTLDACTHPYKGRGTEAEEDRAFSED